MEKQKRSYFKELVISTTAFNTLFTLYFFRIFSIV